MKIPLSWLHEMLPVTPTAQEVAQALTSVGIEVSSVMHLGAGLEDVVVAQIEEKRPHPNADRLSLCKVTDGVQSYAIVCGAQNMKAGDHVAMAKVGASLPNGASIKKSKIRGETSEGMLCSESELKFSDESEGILILPADAPLGRHLGEYLSRNDWLIEVEITPNRGDCLSVTGIARELAAAMNVSAKVPTSYGEGPAETSGPFVAVQDTTGSPRYSLRMIEPVQVGLSPDMIRARLEAAGVRSINNIVDITNYVMLERGQPLHAFDKDKVVGVVSVRRAKEGEKILCLDDIERELNATDLVIADEEGVTAIAGVMGGKRTAVGPMTKSILLESALFDPRSVRKTSRRLALHTESSYRFERGVDEGAVWASSSRAVELIGKHAQGHSVREIDVRSRVLPVRKIHLRQSTLRRILGDRIEDAGEYLARLGLSIEKLEEGWMVEVRSWRQDLEREIDLVEEVARLHGYNRFSSTLPSLAGEPALRNRFTFVAHLRDVLTAAGLQEIRSYSFSSEEEDLLFKRQAAPSMQVLNPASSELVRMRTSLLPALLSVWNTNRSRQREGIRAFEIGNVFSRSGEGTTPAHEELRLGILFAGQIQPQQWYEPAREADFYDGSGLLELISGHISGAPFDLVREGIPSFLHPSQSAAVHFRKKPIGVVGLLHPKICRTLDIPSAVVVELEISQLHESFVHDFRIKPLSPFPSMRRDLAFLVKKSVGSGEIVSSVKKLREPGLVSVEPFDLFEGKGVPDGEEASRLL